MSFAELRGLAIKYFKTEHIKLDLLKGDGSDRRIYRVHSGSNMNRSVIGVWHEDISENRSFHKITKEMGTLGVPVPELYLQSQSEKSYLQQDLGSWNLAETIDHWKSSGEEYKIVPAYKKSLRYLRQMHQGLVKPLARHLAGRLMDQQAYEKDMRYSFDHFFKLFQFDGLYTNDLELEINNLLIQPLIKLGTNHFVFRDFQSRNIMWKDESPWFIDYQSAQLGSLYYDLASLLYASRSGLNENCRKELIVFYHHLLDLNCSIDEFKDNFYHILLIRRLRSLGAYGYLALVKGKKYFLKGIAPTLTDLSFLFKNTASLNEFKILPLVVNEIERCWSDRQLSC